MRRPCEITDIVPTSSGRTKKVKRYSYIVALCRIGGDEVKAVRMDGYERATDVMRDIWMNYPEWKIKGVQRLYDDDFRKE